MAREASLEGSSEGSNCYLEPKLNGNSGRNPISAGIPSLVKKVRGPREKPARTFAASPADEALAVGHTSLRWVFPTQGRGSSLLYPSPSELEASKPTPQWAEG